MSSWYELGTERWRCRHSNPLAVRSSAWPLISLQVFNTLEIQEIVEFFWQHDLDNQLQAADVPTTNANKGSPRQEDAQVSSLAALGGPSTAASASAAAPADKEPASVSSSSSSSIESSLRHPYLVPPSHDENVERKKLELKARIAARYKKKARAHAAWETLQATAVYQSLLFGALGEWIAHDVGRGQYEEVLLQCVDWAAADIPLVSMGSWC